LALILQIYLHQIFLVNLNTWSDLSVGLQCVYEVGRHTGLRFLDLFCEALHTTLSSSSEIEKVPTESFLSSNLPQRMTSYGSSRGWQELKLKIREMSVPILRSLLEEWKKITSHATKVFPCASV
jgi:hypothetical protein